MLRALTRLWTEKGCCESPIGLAEPRRGADVQHILVKLEEFGTVRYLRKSAREECFAHMNYLMLTKALISFRHWPLYYYGLDNFIKFSPSLFISQNGPNYL